MLEMQIFVYTASANNDRYKVRNTQRSIKHALTERWYAWEEAKKLSRSDPEIYYKSPRSLVPRYKPNVYEVRFLLVCTNLPKSLS